jgi:hypothetical protein
MFPSLVPLSLGRWALISSPVTSLLDLFFNLLSTPPSGAALDVGGHGHTEPAADLDAKKDRPFGTAMATYAWFRTSVDRIEGDAAFDPACRHADAIVVARVAAAQCDPLESSISQSVSQSVDANGGGGGAGRRGGSGPLGQQAAIP